MNSGLIITMTHVRAARLDGVGVACAPGIRAWARRYDVDLRAFLVHGMPIERFEELAKVDAFAARIVELATSSAGAADASA